jgi:hypothetical protein
VNEFQQRIAMTLGVAAPWTAYVVVQMVRDLAPLSRMRRSYDRWRERRAERWCAKVHSNAWLKLVDDVIDTQMGEHAVADVLRHAVKHEMVPVQGRSGLVMLRVTYSAHSFFGMKAQHSGTRTVVVAALKSIYGTHSLFEVLVEDE